MKKDSHHERTGHAKEGPPHGWDTETQGGSWNGKDNFMHESRPQFKHWFSLKALEKELKEKKQFQGTKKVDKNFDCI